MTCCPTCGRPEAADVVMRGPLRIEDNPPAAYWHGRRVSLRAGEMRVLRPLARYGTVSNIVLEAMYLGARDANNTVKVYIHHLRRRLAAVAGEDVRIISVPRWGYRLEVAGYRHSNAAET